MSFARSFVVGVALSILLAMVILAPIGSSVPSAGTVTLGSVTLQLQSDGTLVTSLLVPVTNGSTLRYAMDGNFTLLVNALPLNASARTALLAQIDLLEQSQIYGGYFGNHDGTVSPTEVSQFEALILQEARSIPSGSVVGTSSLVVTIDSHRSTSTQLTNVLFLDAPGPDNSTAPMTVETDVVAAFPYTGSAHTLVVSTGVATLPPQLPSLGPNVDLTFSTPSATSITASSGLSGASTSNDVWGWGAASATGTFTYLSNSTDAVTVTFQDSFPTGDVVIGVVVAGAIAGAALFLVLRRRRRVRAGLG